MPKKSKPAGIDELEALVGELESHDAEMRTRIIDVSSRLGDLAQRSAVSYRGKDFNIENRVVDERVYGFLGVDDSGLYLAHRSELEDLEDAMNGIPKEEQGYSVTRPAAWDPRWLRVVGSGERVQEVVEGLKEEIRRALAGRQADVRVVQRLVPTMPVGTGDALISASQGVGDGRIAEDWGKAQRLLAVDPPAAITAASTLLETTLKHIIVALELSLPSDQSVQGLNKVAMSGLKLSQVAAEAEARGIARNLVAIVQNAGALRTKSGDAHGRGPEHNDPDRDLAQIAVTSAGAVCTFLLRRLKAVRPKL